MKIAATLEKIWPELDAYRLRRMKGYFIDDNGARKQMFGGNGKSVQKIAFLAEEPAKIITSGERYEYSRDLSAQLIFE